jgi:hypothetical protein
MRIAVLLLRNVVTSKFKAEPKRTVAFTKTSAVLSEELQVLPGSLSAGPTVEVNQPTKPLSKQIS